MMLLLIAIVLTFIAGALILDYADSGYQLRHFLALLLGISTCVASVVAAILYCFLAWDWMASDVKAQLINREYNTNYTREEIFYASSVIDTIRELDRKRIEVNGDLLREEKAK